LFHLIVLLMLKRLNVRDFYDLLPSMEWTSVNQNTNGPSPSVKIRGSLKTVWADEDDFETVQQPTTEKLNTENIVKPGSSLRPKLNGWLARSHFLVRQETEDLYCDDELHPSLENDPNMQLSIAQQHAGEREHIKPYPPMPMLTDRGNFHIYS
jgi:hypothetical protein